MQQHRSPHISQRERALNAEAGARIEVPYLEKASLCLSSIGRPQSPTKYFGIYISKLVKKGL